MSKSCSNPIQMLTPDTFNKTFKDYEAKLDLNKKTWQLYFRKITYTQIGEPKIMLLPARTWRCLKPEDYQAVPMDFVTYALRRA